MSARRWNKGQKEALDLMISGQNICLTGPGGVGKTELLKYYIEYCSHMNRKVLVTASTGIAATALSPDGKTVHHAFEIPSRLIGPDEDVNISDSLKDCDVVVIDEISMLRFDVFDAVARAYTKAKVPGKNKQLIVCGDMLQLPAVMTLDKLDKYIAELWGEEYLYSGGYPFLSKWWSKLNFRFVELKEIVRQDNKEFCEALNQIRYGNIEGLRWIKKKIDDRENQHRKVPEDAFSICAFHRDVEVENDRKINELVANGKIYRSKDGYIAYNINDSLRVVPRVLFLKIGTRVCSVVNKPGKFSNGSMGTVLKLNSDSVVVNFDDGGKQTVERHAFLFDVPWLEKEKNKKKLVMYGVDTYTQLPLIPAYALTIHRCQGQTVSEPVFIDAAKSWDDGQFYVALSRVKDVSQIYLKEYNERCVHASPYAVQFYENGGKFEPACLLQDYLDASSYITNVSGIPVILETNPDLSVYDENKRKRIEYLITRMKQSRGTAFSRGEIDKNKPEQSEDNKQGNEDNI